MIPKVERKLNPQRKCACGCTAVGVIITSNLPRGTYRTSRHISFQDLQAKGAQILFVSSKSE